MPHPVEFRGNSHSHSAHVMLHEGVFTNKCMATDELHAEKRRNVYVIAVWQEC